MNRYWCARCEYPGKKPFMFGSVVLPTDARHDEIEAALAAAWAEISPHPAPAFYPVAGIIFFQEEK